MTDATLRALERKAKQGDLDAREALRAALVRAGQADPCYGVIYTDPPWAYANFADSAHGAAVNHYDTMDLEALKGLRPVVDVWAAKDCILVMWATWPKLDQAFLLLDAWGFEHVTGAPWLKVVPDSGTIRTGIGFWWQSTSEILLIARRGKPKAKRMPLLALLSGETRAFCDKIGKHSAKPLGVRDWIAEKLGGPYLEMFATRQHPGWTCYGRALGTEITPTGIRAYAPEGATRTIRGEERARSDYHEPPTPAAVVWSRSPAQRAISAF